mmetsp:Transcript_30495/g.59907  ORF Transcript_30495/g.59907 Transcript_30495/m.59907 type:complete len:178 (+) Transcript_30495:698-1231(+)
MKRETNKMEKRGEEIHRATEIAVVSSTERRRGADKEGMKGERKEKGITASDSIFLHSCIQKERRGPPPMHPGALWIFSSVHGCSQFLSSSSPFFASSLILSFFSPLSAPDLFFSVPSVSLTPHPPSLPSFTGHSLRRKEQQQGKGRPAFRLPLQSCQLLFLLLHRLLPSSQSGEGTV